MLALGSRELASRPASGASTAGASTSRERLSRFEQPYLARIASPTSWENGFWSDYPAIFDAAASDAEKLDVVRLLHLGLGDMPLDGGGLPAVFFAYSAPGVRNAPAKTREKVEHWLAAKITSAEFDHPGEHAELDRELARLAAVLELNDAGVLDRVASRWTETSLPQDDVHYLIVAARLAAARSPDATGRVARALLALDGKFAARSEAPGNNWEKRVGEAFETLCRRDPKLPAALVANSEFGAAAHAMFVARLPRGEAREQAIERMLSIAARSEDRPTVALIKLVGELPSESARAWLRENAEDLGLADPVALALAEHPAADDRARFVAALGSVQPAVCEAAARALARLSGAAAPAEFTATPAEYAAALECLRRASGDPNQAALAEVLDRVLAAWAQDATRLPTADQEQPAEGPKKFDAKAAHEHWATWFAARYPMEAALLAKRGPLNAAAWSERLAKIDWARGDLDRGRLVFEKRSCNRCHLGGRTIRTGPPRRGDAHDAR